MRTPIIIALSVILAISGASFAQTFFGPGTALDCSVSQIVINAPGYYLWNQTGPNSMFDNGPAGSSCINITSSDVIVDCTSTLGLEGMIMRSGNSKHGVYVSSGTHNVTVINCFFQDYSGDSRSGIYASEADDITIHDCYLYRNRRGVDAINSDRLTVENSQFIDNVNAGIRAEKSVGSTIQNNSVRGTSAGSGMVIRDVNDTLIDRNTVFANLGHGISVQTTDWARVTGVRIYNNTVYDNGNNSGDDYGIFLRYATDSEIRDNTVYDAGTVQQAGIWLRDVDPSYVTGNYVYDHAGPGIRGADLSEVTFRDNDVYYNGGAGIAVVTNSNPNNPGLVFDGNDIEGNVASGINAEYADGAVFTDNYLYDNGAHGVRLYWSYDTRVYGGNRFEDNANNGLFLDTWCDGARVYGNYFDDNTHGVRAHDVFDLQVYDNEFQDDHESGVRIEDSDTVLIRDNTFDYEGYGVYADPTNNINITGNTINNSDSYGVYLYRVTGARVEGNYIGHSCYENLDYYDGDTFYLADNEIVYSGQCGGGYENVEIGLVDFVTIEDNTIAHASGDGVSLSHCDFAEVDLNYVFDNYGSGLYFYYSDYPLVDRNQIYGNFYEGLYYYYSNWADTTDNDIYGNGDSGVYVYQSDFGDYVGNDVYDNDGRGYLVDIGSDWNWFYQEEVYGNGFVDGWYAFQAEAVTGLTLEESSLHDNQGGLALNAVTSPTIINTPSYNNIWDGYNLAACSGAVLNGLETYNCGHGYTIASSTATMTDCVTHDNSPGAYGLELYVGSNVDAYNFRMYGNADSWLYVDSGSDLYAEDLWVAQTSGPYGILWPTVEITGTETDVSDSNFRVGYDFVSMDHTDSAVSELNVPATLTTYAGGCNGIEYYYLDTGFPASKADIVANGVTFTPSASSCDSSVVATYDVAGFSGYAASGVLSTGSAEDADKKRMVVEAEASCPDNAVTFTVTHNGNPVLGAEVQLMQYTPFGGVVSTETTGSDGTVEFTLSKTAVYRAEIEKSGYEYMNPYVLDFSLCGEEEITGSCTLKGDSSCASDEACVAGLCTKLTGECGYASNHRWVDYGCCADGDCGEGMSCVEHACEAVAEEEQPPAEEDEPEPVPPAEAVPTQEQPTADGAVSEGEEPQVLGQQAAGGDETGAGQGAGMEQQPQQGSNLLLLVLGLLVLAALGAGAYWLLTQQGKARK